MFAQFIIVVIFALGALLAPTFSKSDNTNIYATSVENFDEITVSGINTLKEDHNLWVYIGRESCPYCYEFAPKLADAISNKQTTIHYLDTEVKTENLLAFADMHNIESVPSFVYFENGVIVARLNITNEITSQEIINFISEVNQE